MEDYLDEARGGYWAGDRCAASGILPIARNTRRLCLAWRSAAVHIGSCWGTIGGALRAGLSPEENALVELREEIGYDGPIELHPAYVFTDRGFQYHNFIGLVDSEFGLHPPPNHRWETMEIRWFSAPEVQRVQLYEPAMFHFGFGLLLTRSAALIARFTSP